MADVPIQKLRETVDADRLIIEAAGVANMIAIGAGGMIKGTLMEADFRKALGLRDGELVSIPKDTR